MPNEITAGIEIIGCGFIVMLLVAAVAIFATGFTVAWFLS